MIKRKIVLLVTIATLVFAGFSAANDRMTSSEELSFFLDSTEQSWFRVQLEMSEFDWSIQPLSAGSTSTTDPASNNGGPGGEDDWWVSLPTSDLNLFALNLSWPIN